MISSTPRMSVRASRLSVFSGSGHPEAPVVTCDPCRFSAKTSNAVKYCKDCGGHFCIYCAKTHAKAPATRKHVQIAVTQETAPDKTLGRQKKMCQEHGAKLISFCESHDTLCCNVCVLASHRECAKVVPLSAVADRNYVFRMCKDLESAIKKLQNKFEDLQVQKLDFVKNVEEQTETLVTTVKMYRKSIDGILNKLEEAVMKKKDEYYFERTQQVNGQIKTCKTAINVLDEAYKEVDTTMRETNADMFVNIKRVQGVIGRYSGVLEKIGPSEKDGVKFVVDTNIERFLGGLEALGEILVEKNAARRDLSPSIASSRRSTGDNRRPNFTADVNVKLKSDRKTCFITGATFLFDGRLVLADDTNKCIKLFGSDFKPLTYVSTVTSPRDIIAISHHEVAATLPAEKIVQLLKISGRDIEKKKGFLLDIECYGIAFHAQDIYVTSGWSAEREIQVLAPTGELRRKIRLSKTVFRYPLYITVDPKTEVIYVSDYINGVISLDMTGKILTQCREPDTGCYYKGIEMTTSGQVYVCQWQQNAIARVHTDGRGLETVLIWDQKDRRKPLAIAYTTKTKRLALSFCGEKRDFLTLYKFY
ncbi:hypothetical protein MAR_011112 [Mya arenaria]|uniref:B box-type domain-containing protein n=1 Tax=Mya arenaria TaxID=6604 RepID=A0ABY7FT58_MYAAR|nr:uncharacterized protein LOC128218314 [Mya arenaria]WAR25408.1 hypothetical protein MAR_011112 [Mya arenaria]